LECTVARGVSAVSTLSRGKIRGKISKKWRKMAPFRRPEAPFRRASSRLNSSATCPSARPYVYGARLPRRASRPSDRQWGAISRSQRHEAAYVGSVNLTIVSLLSRVARLGNSGQRSPSDRLQRGRPAEYWRRRLEWPRRSEFLLFSVRAAFQSEPPWARHHIARRGHQATAPRAPLNEDERVKALTDRGLRRRYPGARSEICSSSVVLDRPRSTLFRRSA
jgi:hypothetical protein